MAEDGEERRQTRHPLVLHNWLKAFFFIQQIVSWEE
jgi:hypothetical protein